MDGVTNLISQEKVLALAKYAGIERVYPGYATDGQTALERFASLIAAEVAKANRNQVLELFGRAGLDEALAKERERCAMACEAEAEIWNAKGQKTDRDFRLCTAVIRAMKGE